MFSDNLKALRESQGLYRKGFAELLGLKTTTYQSYESGKSEPSVMGLCKLADFFGISIDELVGHAPPEAANREESDRLAMLSSLARQLGKEDQEKLCEIAKAFVALQKNKD